jgi:DNA-binding XRE family transcriptional regulator
MVPQLRSGGSRSAKGGNDSHHVAGRPALVAHIEDSVEAHQQLGVQLRAAREQCGVTQTEIGRLLGVTYQQIQKYETGRNRITAIDLYRLATALQIDLTWFFASQDTHAANKRSKQKDQQSAD